MLKSKENLPSQIFIPSTDSNIRKIGRYLEHNNKVFFDWSGTGFEFTICGKSKEIFIKLKSEEVYFN